MSDRMPTGQALEQLREVIAILRELGNAGPRDQSFKQWRQVTMTLLQRIWPQDQANAARFRRIPFSPPSSRADAKTIRECYERGVCEAIAYLESLTQELENGSSRLGRKLVRPVEAPLTPPPEPERAHAPEDDVIGSLVPLAPADPAPAPPPSPVRESKDRHAVAKPAPAPAPPERSDDVTPVMPAQAAAPPPGREKGHPRPERRSKPRLKDMLGFADEAPSSSPAHSAPNPPVASAPASPVAPAPVPPAASLPFTPEAPPPPKVTPPPAAPAPAPPMEFDAPEPEPVEPFEPFVAPEAYEAGLDEPVDSDPDLPEEPSDEMPAWSAPVLPFPSHKVVVGRPAEPKPPASFEDDTEEAFDLDFDLADEAGFEAEPPPATLREMLDRPTSPRATVPTHAAMPASASRELLAMASEVDRLGVPRDRRAIVRAALIDLGRQMETPPVHWVAIRQAMAFMMDYPQIARRVIPMLLPYLEEAA